MNKFKQNILSCMEKAQRCDNTSVCRSSFVDHRCIYHQSPHFHVAADTQHRNEFVCTQVGGGPRVIKQLRSFRFKHDRFVLPTSCRNSRIIIVAKLSAMVRIRLISSLHCSRCARTYIYLKFPLSGILDFLCFSAL